MSDRGREAETGTRPDGGEKTLRSVELGTPLNISEVAQFLGCSAWTVRQRYIPQGLPCLRASANGKLVFFHRQVIDWILKRQQQKKGGIPR
jgi:phage terminase Nu1 subunit (DNA packaging protein)